MEILINLLSLDGIDISETKKICFKQFVEIHVRTKNPIAYMGAIRKSDKEIIDKHEYISPEICMEIVNKNAGCKELRARVKAEDSPINEDALNFINIDDGKLRLGGTEITCFFDIEKSDYMDESERNNRHIRTN